MSYATADLLIRHRKRIIVDVKMKCQHHAGRTSRQAGTGMRERTGGGCLC